MIRFKAKIGFFLQMFGLPFPNNASGGKCGGNGIASRHETRPQIRFDRAEIQRGDPESCGEVALRKDAG